VGGFDPDTYYCADTFEASMFAAGAAIGGVQTVMEGRTHHAMAIVRPPGHHATPHQAMGFCHFNNIAVAARFAQKKYGLERVAIIDFDVHHGNGTQDIFYQDPSVFFLSLHQYPLWPMSGLREQRGEGRGKGATLNVPVAPGTPAREYRDMYERALDEVFASKPQLVLISAGFDAHRLDPLASLMLETEDFERMTDSIVQRSEAAGARGIVSALEGGYHLQALAESVEAHVRSLMEA
jgi:acetoin utilization deacetylase AcuC-like enzyme